jgi:Flp pilus assembly protein TadD
MDCKGLDCVELEGRALEMVRANRPADAVHLFEQLLAVSPEWEHGTGFYSLACCYEDLGELKKAEDCFRKALSVQPRSSIFQGGWASFLYLHGKPQDAFEVHLRLLDQGEDLQRIMPALMTLGARLGYSDSGVEKIVKQRIAQPEKQ